MWVFVEERLLNIPVDGLQCGDHRGYEKDPH